MIGCEDGTTGRLSGSFQAGPGIVHGLIRIDPFFCT
jgi:hypothetical protein